jgi:hypothetical protein
MNPSPDPTATGEVDLRPLVAAYRQEPNPAKAQPLLDALAPGMAGTLTRFRTLPSNVTPDDLQQQLLLELLEAAASATLPADGRWIARTLLLRATRATAKWLAREAAEVALPLTEATPAAVVIFFPAGEPSDLAISASELTALHDFHVLGLPTTALAARARVSREAMDQRLSRARRRARDGASGIPFAAERTPGNATTNATPVRFAPSRRAIKK